MNAGKWFICAAIPLLLWAAVVPNLSGTWKLNVEKSRWGKKEKPVGEIVKIQHDEPTWKYSGTVTLPNSEEKTYSYDGALDGKERPVTTAYGPGKITMKRTNRFTIDSVFRSDDGRFTETASTNSTDGKTMTRRV